MLDDAFKLTLDKLFPKPCTTDEPNVHFPVANYSNQENLWEYISSNKKMTQFGVGLTLRDPKIVPTNSLLSSSRGTTKVSTALATAGTSKSISPKGDLSVKSDIKKLSHTPTTNHTMNNLQYDPSKNTKRSTD